MPETIIAIIGGIWLMLLTALMSAGYKDKANKSECELRHDRIEKDNKEIAADLRDIKRDVAAIKLSLAKRGLCDE